MIYQVIAVLIMFVFYGAYFIKLFSSSYLLTGLFVDIKKLPFGLRRVFLYSLCRKDEN